MISYLCRERAIRILGIGTGVLVSLLLLTLTGCSRVKKAAVAVDAYPQIFPDYIGVTVPVNIAPLNFCMASEEFTAMAVHVKGSIKGEMECVGDFADFDLDEWHDIVRDNRGGKLTVTVTAEREGQWIRFRPFDIYVDKISLKEWGVTYRLVAPGYEIYGKQGIFQRCLSDFTEAAIYQTTEVPGTCVNCHTPNATNPDNFTLHIRGEKGATLIRHSGRDDWMKSRNDTIGGPMVFSNWHPTGRYIAFSTNDTRQFFHSQAHKRIEYYDVISDIFIYSPDTHEAITDPRFATKEWMENCPVFSPDGRTLYYITAPYRDPKTNYDKSRYSLCRVSFDSLTATLGQQVDTLVSATATGKSVTWPRPSYDGRYLMFTMLDYGYFSIWHPEADLWLYNLETGVAHALTEANSDDSDSFHNWSKSGGWYLFTSRREDGLYTRIYLASVDSHGHSTKPFLLPQRRPREDNLRRMYSYNTPDFTLKKVKIEDMSRYINSSRRMVWNIEKR